MKLRKHYWRKSNSDTYSRKPIPKTAIILAMILSFRVKAGNRFLFCAVLIVSFFLAVRCTTNSTVNVVSEEKGLNDSSSIADRHTSSNSLDWYGAYYGIVPCADCDGIETVLTLNPDNTFQLTRTYLGKGRDAVGTEGTFSWNPDGNTITLGGIAAGPNQYFVGENRLLQLDTSGQRITGSLSAKYVLQKQETAYE
jgi:copper homeostasis protein (lipoprotein)